MRDRRELYDGFREPDDATAPLAPAPGRKTLTGAYVARGWPTPDTTVQRRAVAGTEAEPADPVLIAHQGLASGGGRLPFHDVVQRAFGRHDLGDVVFHEGPEAAAASRALGARAYTVGPHVAFGGAPDLHTVAHEAAHVVQQRGGVQLQRGLGAAGDVHERHADAVADRVVAGASAEDLLDAYAGGARGGGETVQRAVGFEWEVDSLRLTEVTKKGDRGEPADLPSKAVAFQRGGVRVEVDSGHGEFVTEPADTMNQLEVQLGVIREVVEHLLAAGKEGLYMTAPGDIVYTDDKGGKRGQTWMEQGGWIRAALGSATVSGTFQATSGIDFTPKALLEELNASVQHYPKQGREDWQKQFAAAAKAASPAKSEKVATMIIAIEYFIAACAGGKPSEEDGPKTWMPLLIRTDFRSMFNDLDADKEQPELIGWLKSHPDQGKPLCPEGYKGAKGKEKGPTIGDWLQSIAVERKRPDREADKDLMSPPPGFGRHLTSAAKKDDAKGKKPVAEPIPYAMGLYGLDDGLIVAERRSMAPTGGQKSGRVGYDEMAKLAREFAAQAGLVAVDKPAPPVVDDAPGFEVDDEVDGGPEPVDEDLEIDTSKRAWYQRLCHDAVETVAVYGKGMFDYATIGSEDDELGEVRLTPEHYELFAAIRKARPDVELDAHLLAHAYETGADQKEQIFLYTDIMDSM